MESTGVTVLITGANRGIGREVARLLASRGCQVVVTARNPSTAEEAASAIRKETPGATVSARSLDVDSDASVAQAADRLEKEWGRLDVLINNAGILLDWHDSILELPIERFQETWTTNALGPLRVTRAFLPALRRSPSGRVINVSSAAGQLSAMRAWAPAYSVSKTALNAVTVQLAMALEAEEIAVNAISPGWVRTDMGGDAAPRSVTEGAAGIVELALDAPQSLTGAFLRDGERLEW